MVPSRHARLVARLLGLILTLERRTVIEGQSQKRQRQYTLEDQSSDVTGSSCEYLGKMQITTPEECRKAANYLKLKLGTFKNFSRYSIPGGCVYEVDNRDVDFNFVLEETATNPDRKLICKVPPPSIDNCTNGSNSSNCTRPTTRRTTTTTTTTTTTLLFLPPIQRDGLKPTSSWRATRRVLTADDVREYIEIHVEYPVQVYVRVCGPPQWGGVYVSQWGHCANCTAGCLLSTLFDNLKTEVPTCICGLKFEEIQVRAIGQPGTPPLDHVIRVPPFHYNITDTNETSAFGTGLWQFDGMAANLQCPDKWPEIPRLGLNGLPLSNSLWWLWRFESSFGLDDVDRLLIDASKQYNDREVVLFVPISRIRYGRKIPMGPDHEALSRCWLDFPFFLGPKDEPFATIHLAEVAREKVMCEQGAFSLIQRQIEAVLVHVPDAGKQRVRCRSSWRTSISPDENRNEKASEDEGQAAGGSDKRVRKVGSLASKADFNPCRGSTQGEGCGGTGSALIDCDTYRWQLQLRARNMMGRALSYSATEAFNGCWSLMDSLLEMRYEKTTVKSSGCQYEPTQYEYWDDPCCNPRLSRRYCCAVRQVQELQPVVARVNTSTLAEKCRADQTGSAKFAKLAIMAARTWQRWLHSGGRGCQSCRRLLLKTEHAHADSWRHISRCNEDIMGRYDRRLRRYAGRPCIIDSDCVTECIRPGIRTQQVMVPLKNGSGEARQIVGRCRVPTRNRHVYLVKCIVDRAGPETLSRMAEILKLGPNRTFAHLTNALITRYRLHECIGPYAPMGENYTQASCLERRQCNWHPDITTKEECERKTFDNDAFCGCAEGDCPQISVKAGCQSAKFNIRSCLEAASIIRAAERRCLADAATAAEMKKCDFLVLTHASMLRNCLRARCVPVLDFLLTEDRCYDFRRKDFQNCYDQCNIRSGPTPSREWPVCYREMHANETARDCYETPGDTEVHYHPTAEGWLLNLGPNEREHPRYCSVRSWRYHAPMTKTRTYFDETRRLDNEILKNRNRHLDTLQRTEMSTYLYGQESKREWRQLDPYAQGDCGLLMDDRPGATARDRCHAVQGCCWAVLSIDSDVFSCEACHRLNTTLCSPGDRVFAKWPLNKRLYVANIVEDLGISSIHGYGVAMVRWYYRNPVADWRDTSEVPWHHVYEWTNGTMCTPRSFGCATHGHCVGGQQYCFSCKKCGESVGDDPNKCDPCPTPRLGACGDLMNCNGLKDSVDGICPPVRETRVCPCKAKWSVQEEYNGAPAENVIEGCFYDKSLKKHWCEVEKDASSGEWIDYAQQHEKGEACEAKMLTAKKRFIRWNWCTPSPQCFPDPPTDEQIPPKGQMVTTNIQHCQCDCSPSCAAYNVLPVEGTQPLGQWKNDNGTVKLLDYAMSKLDFVGILAPNCSAGSLERDRGQCSLCQMCCADKCHNNALKARDEGKKLHDCTSTNVTGCIDFPMGWRDRDGRSCQDYFRLKLCTTDGAEGVNWVYDPPLKFLDFTTNQHYASTACCDCGGGIDCSDSPMDWMDPQGRRCDDYRDKRFCVRGTYGPMWDPVEKGTFPRGTGNVDAFTACCHCGGGVPTEQQPTKLLLVTSNPECGNVWPGRSKFDWPPWHLENDHYCRLMNNVCQRRVSATKLDIEGKTAPDHERVFQLCEQRSFATGKMLAHEDGGAMNASRRMGEILEGAIWDLTKLSKTLIPRGTFLSVDFLSNSARGTCFYRLPDPLKSYGGPHRHFGPLLPKEFNYTVPDVFEAPGIKMLGWPEEFYQALPDAIQDIDQMGGRKFNRTNNTCAEGLVQINGRCTDTVCGRSCNATVGMFSPEVCLRTIKQGCPDGRNSRGLPDIVRVVSACPDACGGCRERRDCPFGHYCANCTTHCGHELCKRRCPTPSGGTCMPTGTSDSETVGSVNMEVVGCFVHEDCNDVNSLDVMLQVCISWFNCEQLVGEEQCGKRPRNPGFCAPRGDCHNRIAATGICPEPTEASKCPDYPGVKAMYETDPAMRECVDGDCICRHVKSGRCKPFAGGCPASAVLECAQWCSIAVIKEFEDRAALEQRQSSVGQAVNSDMLGDQLKELLLRRNISVMLSSVRQNLYKAWEKSVDDVKCEGPKNDLKKFQQDRLWQPGYLDDETMCGIPRCDISPAITNAEECEREEGCTKTCPYCASSQPMTQPQGLCYVSKGVTRQSCEADMGIFVEGKLLDEKSGVALHSTVCALPHRALPYCIGPHEKIKRCAYFDTRSCTSDPIAKLMGCFVDIRRCQGWSECDIAGRCTDADLGLTWVNPGMCVVSPAADDLFQGQSTPGWASKITSGGCDARGYCYIRTEPPFGMEIRKRHSLLDLTFHKMTQVKQGTGGSKFDIDALDDVPSEIELSTVGLSREECDTLNKEYAWMSHLWMYAVKATWIERAETARECHRWYSCCTEWLGDRCSLFSGNLVNIDDTLFQYRESECKKCGGTWIHVFNWQEGGRWKKGQMGQAITKWWDRKWTSANRWTETMDVEALRHTFENALESNQGQHRLNVVNCMLNPLRVALQSIASACGLGSQPDPGPRVSIPLGGILCTEGIPGNVTLAADVGLQWHKHSLDELAPTFLSAHLEPFEFEAAMAATQLSLPARAERERHTLILNTIHPTSAPPTEQPKMRDMNKVGDCQEWQDCSDVLAIVDDVRGGPKGIQDSAADSTNVDWDARDARDWAAKDEKVAIDGQLGRGDGRAEAYPQWMIQRMATMSGGNPLDKEASLVTTTPKPVYKPYSADVRLPRGSLDVIDDKENPKQAKAKDGSLKTTRIADPDGVKVPYGQDFLQPSCWNTVSENGVVVGQLLGDCVNLRSSSALRNSVRLCLPVASSPWLPHIPPELAVFDFAKRDIVPSCYLLNGSRPIAKEPWHAGLLDPDDLALGLWTWRASPDFGRLRPGWSKITPLYQEDVVLEKEGTRLCSWVLHSEWTYCPMVRMNASTLASMIHRSGRGLDSECPLLDKVLAQVQDEHYLNQRTSARYMPLDQSVASTETLQENCRLSQEPTAEAEDVCREGVTHTTKARAEVCCGDGQCLELAEDGFQVATLDDPDAQREPICYQKCSG